MCVSASRAIRDILHDSVDLFPVGYFPSVFLSSRRVFAPSRFVRLQLVSKRLQTESCRETLLTSMRAKFNSRVESPCGRRIASSRVAGDWADSQSSGGYALGSNETASVLDCP